MSVRRFGACMALALLVCTAGAPAWARAREAKLAFVHDGQVWTMNADGSGRTRLPLASRAGRRPLVWGAPAWSPDGRWLALARQEGSRVRIELVRPDGSGERALTPAARAPQFSPSWSPDGRRIVFETSSRAGTQIVVADLAGRSRKVLVTVPGGETSAYAGQPAWSPDDSWIAYTQGQLDEKSVDQPSIRLVRPDGTDDHLLQTQAQSPAWSPDGRRIAFSSIRDHNGTHAEGEDEDGVDGEIYVMGADGSDLRRLTDDRGNDDTPSWSADGTRIAFASDRNDPGEFGYENDEIYTVASGGGCLAWLTNGSPESGSPAWRPGPHAGRAAARCGGRPRPRVDVPTAAARRVTRYPALWLGRAFGNRLLSSVDLSRYGLLFDYDDCSSFDPAACPGDLQVTGRRICAEDTGGRLLAELGSAHAARVERGALVVSYVSREDSDMDVLAGRGLTGVLSPTVGTDAGRRLRAAVRALRRYGRARPGLLPAPVLPVEVVAALRRAAKVYDRHHRDLHAAAKALHVSPPTLRGRLRVARALPRLGSVATVRCH